MVEEPAFPAPELPPTSPVEGSLQPTDAASNVLRSGAHTSVFFMSNLV